MTDEKVTHERARSLASDFFAEGSELVRYIDQQATAERELREKLRAAEQELELSRADNRSLNDRLFAALKEAGEAQADEAHAAQSLAHLRLAISEKDEKLIDELCAKRTAGLATHRMVRAEEVEQARREGYDRGVRDAEQLRAHETSFGVRGSDG